MSKTGSRALRGMLPNSRMDRQNRPKTFFRGRERAIVGTVNGGKQKKEATSK